MLRAATRARQAAPAKTFVNNPIRGKIKMAHLLLKNVNKVYPNGFHAVHDFNLEINDGEFICLVGSSGCGKSTTLRMIAGLEDITNGKLNLWVHQRSCDVPLGLPFNVTQYAVPISPFTKISPSASPSWV